MDQTARLALPFIMPAQAQKHITHNEAIEALDALVQPVVESRTTGSPPLTPLAGEAYVIPLGAGGAWLGHGGEIAVFQSGAWRFLEPAEGWQVFVKSDRTQLVFSGGMWVGLASLGAGLGQLGVNTTPDAINRLSVAGAATLLTHDGQGHQLKLNKAAAADTASLLFQSGFSGRAELGLLGDDQWRIKISPDGTSWIDALTVDAGTGTSVATSLRPAGDNAVTLGAADARWSAIWAATGTIQTSDIRQKSDIAASDLGLDFILALRPVRYRWSSGGVEQGQSRPGRRMHYGLIAQEVAAALAGKDFAGHVLAAPDDPQSEQGLRYDAFIAPLIAAVQQLAARVEALDQRLGSATLRSTP